MKYEAWISREIYLGIVEAEDEEKAKEEIYRTFKGSDFQNADYEEEISLQEYEDEDD